MKTGLKKGGVTKTLNSLADVAMEKVKKGKFVTLSVCMVEVHIRPVTNEESSIKDSTDNDAQYIAVSFLYYYNYYY
eukprot:8219167-Heterocapsa_arctica.AAC.1